MLEIKNVRKTFDAFTAVEDVSFEVKKGEFVSIVGPSGCGKTTLLRLILGVEREYEGDILLNKQKVKGTSLERGVVFQEHRLLPWLNLWENIGIALENSPLKKEERKKVIAEQIELVGLKGFEKSYPYQLSGGMAQRAAIARALVNKPSILLLDEPLSSLDAITKMRLQEELSRIWKHEGVSMILVTHDVEEAVFLSEKIIVMNANPGRIAAQIQVDLSAPRDRASADFGAIKHKVFEAMHDNAAILPTEVDYTI